MQALRTYRSQPEGKGVAGLAFQTQGEFIQGPCFGKAFTSEDLMGGQKLVQRRGGKTSKDEVLRDPNPSFRAIGGFRLNSITGKDVISRCIYCRLGIRPPSIVARISRDNGIQKSSPGLAQNKNSVDVVAIVIISQLAKQRALQGGP